jgi:hypothetical protein
LRQDGVQFDGGRKKDGKGHSQDTFIRPQDLALLRVVETAEEAAKALNEFFGA